MHHWDEKEYGGHDSRGNCSSFKLNLQMKLYNYISLLFQYLNNASYFYSYILLLSWLVVATMSFRSHARCPDCVAKVMSTLPDSKVSEITTTNTYVDEFLVKIVDAGSYLVQMYLFIIHYYSLLLLL